MTVIPVMVSVYLHHNVVAIQDINFPLVNVCFKLLSLLINFKPSAPGWMTAIQFMVEELALLQMYVPATLLSLVDQDVKVRKSD